MGYLWVVVLGVGMRLLANNDTSGIVMTHVGMLRKVVLLVWHHVHGVLSCELGRHPWPGHGMVSLLCTTPVRTGDIARLWESVGHGVHIEGTCPGRTLWLRHLELWRKTMLWDTVLLRWKRVRRRVRKSP